MDILARLIGLWWWSPPGRALAIARLRRAAAPGARHVAAALDSARRGRFDDDERDALRRIEEFRRELAADHRSLAEAAGGAAPGEASALSDADRATVSEIHERTAVTPERARLLFGLVRRLRPERCLEMGTGVGVSALYLAAALDLNGAGTLVTMEGSEVRAAVARRNLERLGLDDLVAVRVGTFARTLPAVLDDTRVDVAFVDGHHKEDPTVEYFERIVGAVPGGLTLVFDDIAWSWGMRRAWRRIVADDRVAASADAGSVGICVVRGGR